jgi:uncharacterized protein (DUF427 family)
VSSAASHPESFVTVRLGWRKRDSMKAIWRDTTIAESDEVLVVDGFRYFPPDSVRRMHLRESSTRSTCPWKGVARYYDIQVGGEVNHDAAWTYVTPSDAARDIAGYVAFWRGVEFVD